MAPLAQLMLGLLDAMQTEQDDGVPLRVRGVRVEVPIEARMDGQSGLCASLPRGRMRTGFQQPVGQLRFVVAEREPREASA